MSALITFCTGLASYMGYSTRFELHSVSVADFTKLQRDLVTLIQTETSDEISKQFEEVATKFNEARSRMPLLYPDYLEAYRDEHGKRMVVWNRTAEEEAFMEDGGPSFGQKKK